MAYKLHEVVLVPPTPQKFELLWYQYYWW